VCHPFEYDFFLNSHTGIKGTNSPTHYHVVHDENELGAAELHAMTYKYGIQPLPPRPLRHKHMHGQWAEYNIQLLDARGLDRGSCLLD
jgi:hypothetical protein